MKQSIILTIFLFFFLFPNDKVFADECENNTLCDSKYGTYLPSSDTSLTSTNRSSYVNTIMTSVLNNPWINTDQNAILEFISGAIIATKEEDSDKWGWSYGVGFTTKKYASKKYCVSTGHCYYFPGGQGYYYITPAQLAKLPNGSTATGWGVEDVVKPGGTYEMVIRLDVSADTLTYMKENNLQIKSATVKYLTIMICYSLY